MKNRFSFEFKIVLSMTLAVLIVTAIGVLTYKSFTDIVDTLNKGIKPDSKIVLLKEILSDLSDAESSVKTYTITKDHNYLQPYFSSVSSVDNKLNKLSLLSKRNPKQQPIIDSIQVRVSEKFSILSELLNLRNTDRISNALNKVSKKIGEVRKKEDSIPVEDSESLLRRFFLKQNQIETKDKELEEVQKEIRKVEIEETGRLMAVKGKELQLTKKDKEVMDKIRYFILTMEEQAMLDIASKAQNADLLAQKTKIIIGGFCIAASVLLLIIALVMVNFSRKTSEFNRALKKAKNDAEDLAVAKENFLSNMSHEIRTPMNSIAGFTEQILQTDLNNEQREQLEIVKKSSDHLLKVINDILDFSKVNANKIEIEKIPFDPKEILNEVIDLVKGDAEKKGLALNYNYSGELPHFVKGDPVRLRQILLNIIGNAIKFTDDGSVNLKVHCQNVLSNHLEIVFKVKDTGVGIAKNKLHNIFNEFVQADTSITREYGGTGLGLTITKKLVELHKGKITIDSKPNKGTEVTISIPYEIIETPCETKETNFEDDFLDLEGVRVLVADDEKYNRMLIQSILKKWKVSTEIATNGKEAVALIEKHTFDIVLMDLRMPVMSGFEATKKIRNLQKKSKAEIPILALTATTAKEEIELCKKIGIDSFLSKPFKEYDLYERIKMLINLKVNSNNKNNKPPSQLTSKKEFPHSNKGYDLTELKEQFADDTTFYIEMVMTFIRTTNEGVKHINKGIKDKDWEKVADAAHKIAPPCTHLKAYTLLELIKEIEDLARNNRETEKIPILAEKLAENVHLVVGSMEAELNNEGVLDA